MTDGYPSIRNSTNTGEVGVNAVASIVNDKFQWLFRRNHNEHDFGIDGYIDIVLDDGAVTGQCIAVQIKTGQSFIKNKTQHGFVFYGERKHLNYYLNLPMPVIIVVHDDITRKTYWQLFSPESIESTPTAWKTEISFSKQLPHSKNSLIEIVGPAIDHLSELESHWSFSKSLSQFDYILYAIDREDVERGNTKPIQQFFRRIESSDSLCRKFQGKVEISISGYDTDKRELWEIREVKKWYKKANPKINWLFFCNTDDPAHGFKAYFACLSDTKRNATPHATPTGRAISVSMDNEKRLDLLTSNWPKLNAMTDRLGMPLEENKRISFAALDALEIPHE